MKTLDKFILKSYLGPMVLTFFIVSFIFLMNFLWRFIDTLVGKGLGLDIIFELMGWATATTIPMSLPLATLLAALMTMGNLGENNELLAMKSAGVSLPRIMMPLSVLVLFVAIASFFASNNLVPYAWKQMDSILYDIKQQKQTIEFKDGTFFNGIDDMSIRVGHQDPKTGLLNNVLIYDTRDANGNMSTTIADSGYIRLSDDKKFLLVTLYDGERYETTRNYLWNEQNELRHQIFHIQDALLPIDGFDMERSDSNSSAGTQTKTIDRLSQDIDSLNIIVSRDLIKSYEPFLRGNLLQHDPYVMGFLDSVKTDYSYRNKPNVSYQNMSGMKLEEKRTVINNAISKARNSQNSINFEEDMIKSNLNDLYRSQIEWHRKVSLPISIMIFFLIGAPLGAIIRKGGLGMPVVVSVLFFVAYYIVSIAGEKMARDGIRSAFYGMWLSSFILLPIAIYLIYKSTNDSNLFNVDWYRIQFSKLKAKIGINRSKKNIKDEHGTKEA